MKPKRHVVFGRSMSYEQVADALYMNVQTLRTVCGKKCGGDLEKYLISRGINQETFDNIMEGTAIVKADTNDQKTEGNDNVYENEETADVKAEDVNTDQAVDTMMRAIFGDGYESGDKEEPVVNEEKNVNPENGNTDDKNKEIKKERIKLIMLNRTIEGIEGVSKLIEGIGNTNQELQEEIDRCGLKLSTLLDAFRLEKYSHAINWDIVAEHMGETENESNADLRPE